MSRLPVLFLTTSLLASCACGPAVSTPLADPTSLQEEVDDAVSAIDADLSSMTSEEANDPSQHLTAIALRKAGSMRKMVVIKKSDEEISTTHYFFSPDETLIFVGRKGDRLSRTNGRLDTVTSLDGEYYFAGSNITASMLLTARNMSTGGGDHDILKDATAALRLFDSSPSGSPPAV